MEKSTLSMLVNLHVLIAEDDEFLGEALLDELAAHCALARLARDGESALNLWHAERFDLVISDISMPRLSGLGLARALRSEGENVPIIMISAFDSERNIREAAGLGIAAFLHKPFEIEALYNALFMAAGALGAARKSADLGRGFSYDFEREELSKDGEFVPLTRTENALLALLARHAGRVVSIEQIVATAWYGKSAAPATVRVYINKLRDKTYPELIQNVQGYGYKLQI